MAGESPDLRASDRELEGTEGSALAWEVFSLRYAGDQLVGSVPDRCVFSLLDRAWRVLLRAGCISAVQTVVLSFSFAVLE